jgi:triacylglycerol lipase
VTTTAASGASLRRVHVVLVPGFAGFDALGQVEYYAGTTDLFRRWQHARRRQPPHVVLHYFPTLPTAGVATRAHRLRVYLAKRLARGEIAPEDTIALVGHSTGGLDIRRMLNPPADHDPLHLDGGDHWRDADATAVPVAHDQILRKVTRAVFVSVPQYGTNIADWVRAHTTLRRAVIAEFQAAVEGARLRHLEQAMSALLTQVARLTGGPDLVLAARDALDETQATTADPTVQADAQEAGSQLRLWLAHAADDFGAIDDLASYTQPPPGSTSPAHHDETARVAERALWEAHDISTMSIATIARRAYRFDHAAVAAPLSLLDPGTWPNPRNTLDARAMDVSYLLAYRACAGGHFAIPPPVADLCTDINRFDTRMFDPAQLDPDGPAPGTPLAVWDNDGIVNTASMLWPDHENTMLIAADHLDVVGHYAPRLTIPSPDPTGRRYAAYDALRSHTHFTPGRFDDIWTAILDFCVS